MRLSLLVLALALVASPVSFASASSSSLQQLSHKLSSVRSFRPLAAGDDLPAGLPSLGTPTFIQFPNGINVILKDYGTASLPQGYPISSIPSYDAASNTITDPAIAYAFAYALSTAANPSYDPNNPDAFLSQGGFIPGLTGVFGDDNGVDASGTDDGGLGTNDGGLGTDDSGTDDGGFATGGLVLPGAGTGSALFPTTVVIPSMSSTGVAVIVNPPVAGSTGVSNGGARSTGSSGNVGSTSSGSNTQGGTTPISNPNNPKNQNGASMVASSLAMVTGLVAAVVVATVL